jgi:collagenase-like PrtC family protease
MPKLELLSPARNLAFGLEAICHGADAVYIGGPAFGARSAAGNSVADIGRLAAQAHRFNARVLVALNTILRDDELEDARRIAWQAFDAGADALILQDMGLLELDLPPIQLHASTQCDIRTPEKARFLEAAGFSQLVLARELSLAEISAIAAQATATLEFFVHGALCVSYSGQCSISHALTGRSANRGECSQMCRLPYTLADDNGKIIARDRHLLSLKDNDQGGNLRALADAGIRSFKIEGRLKDLAYVKNITAHYRRLLDRLMEEAPEYRPSSSGRCTFLFAPRPEKTFNRGPTDYFVTGRHEDIGAFDTPKFAGEPVGRVTKLGRGWFQVDGDEIFHNGDGLAYFAADNELAGLRINRVDSRRLFPADMPADLTVGTLLLRNRDQAFERQLEKKSAERRIAVRQRFEETEEGFALALTDEDGIAVTTDLAHAKQLAANPAQALATIRENLGKLGNTIFASDDIVVVAAQPWFLPASAINALRRQGIEQLEAARLAAYRRPQRATVAMPPAPYPETELTYLGNVFNGKARRFYEKHGVLLIAAAFEAGEEKGDVPLMITRHCLRFCFHLCPKQVQGIKPEPMTLINGSEKLTLRFDCKRCEMLVIGRLKKSRHGMIAAA